MMWLRQMAQLSTTMSAPDEPTTWGEKAMGRVMARRVVAAGKQVTIVCTATRPAAQLSLAQNPPNAHGAHHTPHSKRRETAVPTQDGADAARMRDAPHAHKATAFHFLTSNRGAVLSFDSSAIAAGHSDAGGLCGFACGHVGLPQHAAGTWAHTRTHVSAVAGRCAQDTATRGPLHQLHTHMLL